MATSITLPELGESVTEGTVTRWLKQIGDEVAVDEPLLEISTDKVDTEIPSPAAGTLLEIKAQEDETVEVGAELATIGEAGEQPAGQEPAQEPAQEQGAAAQQAPAQEEAPAQEAPAQPAPAQPAPAQPAPAQPAPAQETPPPSPEPAAASSADASTVTLPELGESVTEGTVTRWLKQIGDEVAVDEPLLEISTDKVDTEIPSPAAGTLLEIKAQEDETVEVGAELAVIGSGQPAAEQPDQQPAPEQPAAQSAVQPSAPPAPEPAPQPAPQPAQQQAQQPEPQPAPEPAPQPAPQQAQQPEPQPAPEPAPHTQKPDAGDGGDIYVTPIVRKLARQHNVDLTTVEGTGVGGRIRKQDVLDAAQAAEAPEPAQPSAAQQPAPAAGQTSELRGKTEKISRLRRTIAKHMHESLQVSAQLTTVLEADVTEIARLRAKHKDAFAEREGVKLSFLPFFAKATVEALKAYPQANSRLDMDAGTVTYPDGEHLGIAVDTPKGLIVPVIHDAGDLSVAGLARRIDDVACRTRAGEIKPDELSGGTFTVTNTGSRGALFDTPIINQPQVGILGTGAVVKRPVVINDPQGGDSIAVRHMAYLALTYDHRIVDGADAARFLTAIKERLESGEFEAELG